MNVVCIYHDGGVDWESNHRWHLRPFVEQGRASVLTLAGHVAHKARLLTWEWSEAESQPAWEAMPFEIFPPVFNYPAVPRRPEPAVYPSCAIIQGNIEPLRRNYKTVIRQLNESLAGGSMSAPPDATRAR